MVDLLPVASSGERAAVTRGVRSAPAPQGCLGSVVSRRHWLSVAEQCPLPAFRAAVGLEHRNALSRTFHCGAIIRPLW